MGKVIRAERKKMKRQHDLSVSLCVGSLVLFWTLWTVSGRNTSPEQLSSVYNELIFRLILVHVIIMPSAMCVLASRIWDTETKGDSLRLLFTLQERTDLFWGKVLIGLSENLLICIIIFGGIPLWGTIQGYTQPLPIMIFLWTFLSTLCTNGMIYLFALFFSIRTAKSSIVMTAGILFSLTGLFAAYLPQTASLLLPWSYYVPLSTVEMDWIEETQTVLYRTGTFCVPLLIFTVVLGIVFFILGQQQIRKTEV